MHDDHSEHTPAPMPMPEPTPEPIPAPVPMTAEMMQADALVPAKGATHVIARSGCWCDTPTWLGLSDPGPSATIRVPAGVTLELMDDDSDRYCQAIRVDGTLKLSPGAGLTVETLLITPTGRLEIGSAEAPIPRDKPVRVTIADPGPIDRAADPAMLGRGIISMGAVAIYGEAVTPFVQCADAVGKGAQAFRLATQPENWRARDALILSGIAPGQREVCGIASISGNVLALSTGALAYSRVSPPTIGASVAARMRCHVANLERAVRFRCEATDPARRAHFMSMCSPDVTIAYASFNGFGRTDKSKPISNDNPRGRYAVHFHKTGHDEMARVRGVVVNGSPGWGIVNHSSWVQAWDCVTVDCFGAGFVTEAGDETGSFDGNLAIGSTGSGQPRNAREDVQDFGHGGNGFWFQGPYVTVENNIATGHPDGGYVYWAKGLVFGGVETPFPASALSEDYRIIAGDVVAVPVKALPATFRNNVSYGCPLALGIFFVGIEPLSGSSCAPGVFICDDLFSWGGQNGVYMAYNRGGLFRRPTVVGSSGSGISMDSTPTELTVDGGYFDRLGIGVQALDRGFTTIAGAKVNATIGVLVRPLFDSRDDRPYARTVNISDVTPGPATKTAVKLDWSAARAKLDPNQIRCLFAPDTITVDGKRVRFAEQVGPVVIATPWWPPEWSGLTNREIFDKWGIGLGGSLAPAGSTRDVPPIYVDGFIEPLPPPEPSAVAYGSAVSQKAAGKTVVGSYYIKLDGVQDKAPTPLEPGKLHAIKRGDRTVLLVTQ